MELKILQKNDRLHVLCCVWSAMDVMIHSANIWVSYLRVICHLLMLLTVTYSFAGMADIVLYGFHDYVYRTSTYPAI